MQLWRPEFVVFIYTSLSSAYAFLIFCPIFEWMIKQLTYLSSLWSLTNNFYLIFSSVLSREQFQALLWFPPRSSPSQMLKRLAYYLKMLWCFESVCMLSMTISPVCILTSDCFYNSISLVFNRSISGNIEEGSHFVETSSKRMRFRDGISILILTAILIIPYSIIDVFCFSFWKLGGAKG